MKHILLALIIIIIAYSQSYGQHAAVDWHFAKKSDSDSSKTAIWHIENDSTALLQFNFGRIFPSHISILTSGGPISTRRSEYIQSQSIPASGDTVDGRVVPPLDKKYLMIFVDLSGSALAVPHYIDSAKALLRALVGSMHDTLNHSYDCRVAIIVGATTTSTLLNWTASTDSALEVISKLENHSTQFSSESLVVYEATKSIFEISKDLDGGDITRLLYNTVFVSGGNFLIDNNPEDRKSHGLEVQSVFMQNSDSDMIAGNVIDTVISRDTTFYTHQKRISNTPPTDSTIIDSIKKIDITYSYNQKYPGAFTKFEMIQSLNKDSEFYGNTNHWNLSNGNYISSAISKFSQAYNTRVKAVQLNFILHSKNLIDTLTVKTDSMTFNIFRQNALTVVESQRNIELFMYPNPAIQFVMISSKRNESVTITDIAGKTVLNGFTNKPILLSNVDIGTYFVHTLTSTNKLEVIR
jgi:hypothetical protein